MASETRYGDALTVQSGTLLGRAALAGAAFAVALATDFVTKWLIVNSMMAPPHMIEIAPFFNLTLSFNTGVSFGMFRELFLGQPMLLAAIMAAIAAALFVCALRTTRRIETYALGLITGGAAGNVVDRVRYGAVTDFLDLHVGDWHWPAFNMADVMITVGVLLLILSSFLPRSSASLAKTEERSRSTS